MAALEFRLAETLGGPSKPGWSPRKGRRLSPFLGASRIAIRPISRFFFQLGIHNFMPGWCFRWVLLRAKEETLRFAKLDRSSHGSIRRWLIRVYLARDHETHEGNITIEPFRVPCGNYKPP